MARSLGRRGLEATERLHKTIDVPQANKLENVRQLAAAVRDGISHRAALLELLSVDARHYAYCRQAALVLRVVAEGEGDTLVLTDSGRRLLASRSSFLVLSAMAHSSGGRPPTVVDQSAERDRFVTHRGACSSRATARRASGARRCCRDISDGCPRSTRPLRACTCRAPIRGASKAR